VGDWELAQVNVSDAVAALESPRLSGFRQRALPLDALARRSPGFVWRPEPAEVDPADLAVFGDPSWVVVNLSVWESVDALRAYVYAAGHAEALRLRRRWFTPPAAPGTALWWVPAGERPTFAEARRRLELLRTAGPTAEAFPLSHPHPPPA
jgi:hypothetical protein